MVPLVCGALLLTIRERPSVVGAPNRILDATLIVGLVLAAATLVQLPAAMRVAIAPHAPSLDQALFFGAPPVNTTGPPVDVFEAPTVIVVVVMPLGSSIVTV